MSLRRILLKPRIFTQFGSSGEADVLFGPFLVNPLYSHSASLQLTVKFVMIKSGLEREREREG